MSVLAFGRAPGTFYVDADHGKDTWDGSTDFAHRDESNGIGPRKTLVGIMEVANTSGDVVYAAAGTYAERALARKDAEVTLNRVIIPAGVRLESLEGAKRTFIVGAPATVAPDANGLGEGATRCVAMGAGSQLVGFTLTGGRTTAGNTDDGYVGGVFGSDAAGSLVSDCIVSNCVAQWEAIGRSSTWVRCRMSDNKGLGYDAGVGGGRLFNCYMENNSGSYIVYQPSLVVNCTILGDGNLKSGASTPVYNSAILTVNGCTISNCVYVNKDPSTVDAGGCTKLANVADFGFDAEGRSSAACLVDAGGNDALDLIPEAFRGTDREGVQRIYGGTVDIGSSEHDLRADVTAALGNPRVTVTALTKDVTAGDDGNARLRDGDGMAVSWTAPFAGTVEYNFTATAADGGTLKCYLGDAAEPFETVSDGEEVVVFHADESPVALRFAYEGEGAGRVGDFRDVVSATITDAKGGLVLTGIGPGTTVVPAGETKTFTVSRNFTTDRLCTGFLLNGETFVDLGDYPDGWTHTLDTIASSVTIEAQYKTAQDFYVDPVKGNDARSGFLPGQAWKTLLPVSTNANVRSGDVVYAAAGTYAEGALARKDTEVTLNRVIIPAGVRFESLEGAKRTFIVGAPATVGPDANGLGEGATRCVAMGAGSQLVGFTLTGGRTTAGNTDDGFVGGVFGSVAAGSLVSDCIVSNCVAQWRAIGQGSTWVRCRMSDNKGLSYDAGVSGGRLFNCYMDNNSGSYIVYTPSLVVNCTILGSGNVKNNNASSYIYNSAIATVNGCTISNCVYVGKDPNTVDAGGCTKLANVADFGFDAEGRSSAACLVDAGGNDALDLIPEEFRGTDREGIQRIFNGAVDIGSSEFDKRPDFTRDIGRKLTVTAASSNVVETAEGKVRINDGQVLEVGWADQPPAPLARTFPISVRAGTLTVKLNGETVATFTADGEWRTPDPVATDVMAFAFEASAEGGFAEIGKTSGGGLVIIVR